MSDNTVLAETLEPYSDEELDHLAEVIADAKMRGIEYGGWSLARHILAAGYRLLPNREIRYGECRACAASLELNEHGALVDHHDARRQRPCIGAHNTPLRLVAPPEVVSADAR